MPPPDFSVLDYTIRRQVTRLFFDVDDTLTWQGELVQEAVHALYLAKAAGIALVAVTGRSNAWAEALLRLFPLEVLQKVPTARLALDNIGREYETAFDLIEDGPALSPEDAAAIREIL